MEEIIKQLEGYREWDAQYRAWYQLYLVWYNQHQTVGTVKPMDGGNPPPPPPFPPHPNKV